MSPSFLCSLSLRCARVGAGARPQGSTPEIQRNPKAETRARNGRVRFNSTLRHQTQKKKIRPPHAHVTSLTQRHAHWVAHWKLRVKGSSRSAKAINTRHWCRFFVPPPLLFRSLCRVLRLVFSLVGVVDAVVVAVAVAAAEALAFGKEESPFRKDRDEPPTHCTSILRERETRS